ncbi:hypothetical protein [Candidatus Palauibacter sp.]
MNTTANTTAKLAGLVVLLNVVALANALLYPRFFREGACVSGREDAV